MNELSNGSELIHIFLPVFQIYLQPYNKSSVYLSSLLYQLSILVY